MKRWLAVLPLLALGALAVMFLVWTLHRDPQIKPDAMVGRPLPASAVGVLADAEADTVLDAAVQGPAVVNLFASWCAPCRVEHPELMRLQARGVRLVGLAYKDDPADTRAFLSELGDPFALVLTDRRGLAGIDLGVSGVPETFVVDADRRIVAKHAGPLTPEDADRLYAAWRAAGGV